MNHSTLMITSKQCLLYSLLLLIGSALGTSGCLETKDEREIALLPGQAAQVTSLAFNSDGTILISASADNTIRLRDIASLYEALHDFDEGSDGSHIYMYNDVVEIDPSPLSGRYNGFSHLALTADDAILAAGTSQAGLGGIIMLWSLPDGIPLQEIVVDQGEVTALCMAPDNRHMAVASTSVSAFGSVTLWDLSTFEKTEHFPDVTGEVRSLHFSSDGALLVGAQANGTALVWDVGEVETKKKFQLEKGEVTAASLSPDGIFVAATGFEQKQGGILKLWDFESEEVRFQLRFPATARSVAFSPSGKLLAIGCDNHDIYLHDTGTGVELSRLDGHTRPINTLVFSPDAAPVGAGAILASGAQDQNIFLWDVMNLVSLREEEDDNDD